MLCLCLIIHLNAEVASRRLYDGFHVLGLKTFFVTSFTEAREMLGQVRFDVVLLDDQEISLDRTVDLLETLSTSEVPTYVVRGDLSEDDQIAVLKAGAWGSISPNASTQLAALTIGKASRLAMAIPQKRNSELTLGPLRLNAAELSATVNGVALDVSPRQVDMLFILATRAGKVVHRSALEKLVGVVPSERRRSVDMHLSRIRKCLKEAGHSSIAILSVHGFGYCLSVVDAGQLAAPMVAELAS